LRSNLILGQFYNCNKVRMAIKGGGLGLKIVGLKKMEKTKSSNFQYTS
jgi:hypothetical protein